MPRKKRTDAESTDFVDDPILAPTRAAKYLDISTRTLRRIKLERTPMISSGTLPRLGYRRSVLNRELRRRKREDNGA